MFAGCVFLLHSVSTVDIIPWPWSMCLLLLWLYFVSTIASCLLVRSYMYVRLCVLLLSVCMCMCYVYHCQEGSPHIHLWSFHRVGVTVGVRSPFGCICPQTEVERIDFGLWLQHLWAVLCILWNWSVAAQCDSLFPQYTECLPCVRFVRVSTLVCKFVCACVSLCMCLCIEYQRVTVIKYIYVILYDYIIMRFIEMILFLWYVQYKSCKICMIDDCILYSYNILLTP